LAYLSPTAALRARVEEYADHHRNSANQALHYFGIPALAISSLGLLSAASWPVTVGGTVLEPSAAWLALIVAAVWYLRLDRATGLLTLTFLIGCYAAGSFMPTGVLLGLFGTGGVAHLVGHFGFEGKPPAVFTTPLAVLEAPAWLVSLVLGS
jgi:uncharacterized membrane protein YGL010W